MSDSFEETVLETISVGSSVIRVLATDEDTGNNGKIIYSIVSGNIDSTFYIDPDSGHIFAVKKLEVRLQPEYHLVVKAMDMGETAKFSFANVRLIIVVPDYVAPKFDKSTYTVDVSESTKVNRVIFSGYKIFSKQSLTYELIGENAKLFNIDYYNGEVTLKGQLDYEKVKMYEFMIKATNLVSLSDNATVIVNVVDCNDNPPKWNETNYFGYISDDADRGSPVIKLGSHGEDTLKLLAYDEDSGINSELEFYINEPHGRKYFYINPTTFEVILLREIDFEETPSINFTVSISDSASENSMESDEDARVSITVTLPDPMFDAKSYSIDISEDTQPGYIIFNGIQGKKQKLKYEIVAFGEDKRYLEVNINTGVITLASSVDYELKKDIKFVLTATNAVGGKDSASFVINVLDENDCPPKWNRTVFSGHINEDAEPGSVVLNDMNQTLTLEAYDDDSGRNSRLEYYINEAHGMEYFTVSPSSGVVTLKNRLSYDKKSTVIFTVSVTDLGERQLKGDPDALVVISVERSARPTTTTTTSTTTTSTVAPDPCLMNPCVNSGTCKRTNGTYRSIEDRSVGPSNSRASKVNDKSSSSNATTTNNIDFICLCPNGWTGDLCQESTFVCNAIFKPCKNHGICQERISESICQCPSGFTGDLCEEDIDECSLSDAGICPPPATCINLPGSYRCVCSQYLINGSTGNCPTSQNWKTSLPISFDEILFILCLLFTLVLTCCCFSCCWKFKSKDPNRRAPPAIATPIRNRTPAKAYSGSEANELLYKNSPVSDLNGLNLKRFSKLSSTINGVTTSLTNSPVPSSIRELPISLNNFDNIRIVGIVGEEGEIYSLAPSTDPSGKVTLTATSIAGSSVALAAVVAATSSNNSTATPSPIASVTGPQQQQHSHQNQLLHQHQSHSHQQQPSSSSSLTNSGTTINGSTSTIIGEEIIYHSSNTQRMTQQQQQQQQQPTQQQQVHTLQINHGHNHHNGHCQQSQQLQQPQSTGRDFTQFLTNLKKANPPPIVTVTPQVTFNDAMCSSHSGSSCSSSTIINAKIQNGRSSL